MAKKKKKPKNKRLGKKISKIVVDQCEINPDTIPERIEDVSHSWTFDGVPAPLPLPRAFINPFFLTIKLTPMKALELTARANPFWLSTLSIKANYYYGTFLKLFYSRQSGWGENGVIFMAYRGVDDDSRGEPCPPVTDLSRWNLIVDCGRQVGSVVHLIVNSTQVKSIFTLDITRFSPWPDRK